MLNLLSLHNFKSARNLEVPLKPLTVLSGLNGSGKSTVLQSISLILQNLPLADNFFSPISNLHLNGNMVHLGTVGNILSDRADDKPIKITLTSDFVVNGEWECQSGVSNADDILPLLNSDPVNMMIESLLYENGFQFLQADRLIPQTLFQRADSISRRRQFLGTHGQFTPDFLAEQGDLLTVSEKRRCVGNVAGLPPELMARIDATPKLYAQISRWLQYLSPGIRLNAEQLSETDSVKLAFSYASTETAQNSPDRRPTHVGFGLTYCLPILTACLAAPSGSLLLLENPEAHLHPRGQAAMGLLLAKCAADGVQIIVETHSDHILNGIRLAVKNSASGIESDMVQLCNFTRHPITGDSYIEAPIILSNGELSAWPDGFFDQWEKSLEALLG
jgi:predicted ATPase